MRSDVVGFAKQTQKGTGVYTAEYFVPVESADASPNSELLEITETLGKRFPSDPPDRGSSQWEVTASGAVRPGALPRMLSSFMGAPTSVSTSGAFQHTFDMYAADTALVLHSILVGRADPTPKITDWAYDCYGASMEISVAPNDYMKFNGTWNGRSANTSQTFPASPTSDATPKYPYYQVLAYITVNTATETVVTLGEATITITNEIDLDYLALGAQDPYDIGVGNGNVEVSFTPLQNLDVWLRRGYPGNVDDIKLRLVATGSVIGTTAYTVEFTCYRGRVTETSAPVNAGEILKGVPVTLQFAKDKTLAKFLDARVINTVASY